ncbi:hypothetical protein ACP4OV_026706 [Aristida adscensionis]
MTASSPQRRSDGCLAPAFASTPEGSPTGAGTGRSARRVRRPRPRPPRPASRRRLGLRRRLQASACRSRRCSPPSLP